MGRPPGWSRAKTGRAGLRSAGRPSVAQREHRQVFWRFIAQGLSSEDAGRRAGVSAQVGVRWFRKGGGMPVVLLKLGH